jgi:hypothetical protein
VEQQGHQRDNDRIVRRACEQIGIDPPSGASVQAETFPASALPFLGATLGNQASFRVHLPDFLRGRHRPPAVSLSYVNDLTVWVLGESLQIVFGQSAAPAAAARVPQRPDVAEETRQLTAAAERYAGIPRTAPSKDLLTVIATLQSSAPGNIRLARAIHFSYVLHDTARYRGRAVWIIDTRGIPPFEDVPRSVPVDARNHLRHIVDAGTGEWLSSDTIPQPTTSSQNVA